MNTTKAAVGVLSDAEAKLRELVGQAAAGGEYDLAVRMATVAKNVAALGLALGESEPYRQLRSGEAPLLAPGAEPIAVSTDHDVADSAKRAPAGRRRVRSATRAGRGGGAGRKRAPKKGVYPKFFREGDYLVKVSWSKKERGEYQHKAPRRVAELLAAAIGRRAGNGRMFTSEDIFPLKDPQGGGEVPSYQAYAALAWFRQSGLVRAHGRRGYTAKNHGRLSELLKTAWEQVRDSRD